MYKEIIDTFLIYGVSESSLFHMISYTLKISDIFYKALKVRFEGNSVITYFDKEDDFPSNSPLVHYAHGVHV